MKLLTRLNVFRGQSNIKPPDDTAYIFTPARLTFLVANCRGCSYRKEWSLGGSVFDAQQLTDAVEKHIQETGHQFVVYRAVKYEINKRP